MTCQGCHPECSVVQLSVQIYDMFLFGYLYAYYFMQSGSGPASIYTMFQRGSEYLPAARTSGVDPANLRRRVAGVIDGRSSACRFRRDCEPANGSRLTAHGSRRTTMACACDIQPQHSASAPVSLARSLVIAASARLTGVHCEAWTSLRPLLAPHSPTLITMPPSSRQILRPATYMRSLSVAASTRMQKLIWVSLFITYPKI